jgi:hypothetical protein
MKGEQLQNFVQHRFSRPDPATAERGQRSFPPARTLRRLSAVATLSPGARTWLDTWTYRWWAARARKSAAPFRKPSREKEPQRYALYLKQKRLWAWRQRVLRRAVAVFVRPGLRKRLNADFVDALMGWRPGWTSALTVFGVEETACALFRERQHLRSLFEGL